MTNQDNHQPADQTETGPLFSPGKILATAAVDRHMTDSHLPTRLLLGLLSRHLSGDWGDVCEDDSRASWDALKYGDRLMSVYKNALAEKTVWVITEADRSVTTFLFPGDY